MLVLKTEWWETSILIVVALTISLERMRSIVSQLHGSDNLTKETILLFFVISVFKSDDILLLKAVKAATLLKTDLFPGLCSYAPKYAAKKHESMPVSPHI